MKIFRVFAEDLEEPKVSSHNQKLLWFSKYLGVGVGSLLTTECLHHVDKASVVLDSPLGSSGLLLLLLSGLDLRRNILISILPSEIFEGLESDVCGKSLITVVRVVHGLYHQIRSLCSVSPWGSGLALYQHGQGSRGPFLPAGGRSAGW